MQSYSDTDLGQLVVPLVCQQGNLPPPRTRLPLMYFVSNGY